MSSNFNVKRSKFPVTLENWSLHDFVQYDALDGIAYNVLIKYKGNAVCSLSNRGDGGETEIYVHDTINIQTFVTMVEKLLRQLNAVACENLNQTQTFLHEVYIAAVTSNRQRAVCMFEGLFETLYEFNEVYNARKDRSKDIYVGSVVGNGSILAAHTPCNQCCGCLVSVSLHDIIAYTQKHERRCNYVFKVPANTHVLHLTLDDVRKAFVTVAQAYKEKAK